MLNKKTFHSQSGQVAVVVFLIMAVMLVVGLSLASRTSQEIELAGQQEDTTRVFNAAETGIEEALSSEGNFIETDKDLGTTTNTDTQTKTSVTIKPKSGFENTFESGETATVFVNSAQTGSLNINWGTAGASDCGNLAVLVVTTYAKVGTNYEAKHYGIRPDNCHGTTNFSPISNPGETYEGTAYTRKFTLNLTTTGTEMVRIKPLIASAPIYVSGNVLSSQSHTVRSEAQDNTSGNTEVRAIEVTRTKPAPPAILDYALYSGGTLSK